MTCFTDRFGPVDAYTRRRDGRVNYVDLSAIVFVAGHRVRAELGGDGTRADIGRYERARADCDHHVAHFKCTLGYHRRLAVAYL